MYNNRGNYMKMSSATSPVRLPSKEMDGYYDPSFSADINTKMRVPKTIRVTGGEGDSNDDFSNGNVNWSSRSNGPGTEEKFEMHVPDRILVVGQDQHVGTRAPPRELILENAVMPPDPGIVRVQTPPRVISLGQHSFPTVEDLVRPESEDSDSGVGQNNGHPDTFSSGCSHLGPTDVDTSLILRDNSVTQPLESSWMAPSEELQHLRRQVARLNRRLMVLEMDQQSRQQKEKLIMSLGLAYLVLKAFLLFRSAFSRN